MPGLIGLSPCEYDGQSTLSIVFLTAFTFESTYLLLCIQSHHCPPAVWRSPISAFNPVPKFYLLSIHLINFLINFDFLYPFSTSWWFWLSLSFSLLISHLHFHWKWSQNSTYSRSISSTFWLIFTFSTRSQLPDDFDFNFLLTSSTHSHPSDRHGI